VEIGRGASADWFEDGTRAVQTRGARRGERGEPRILCCVQTKRPPSRDRCEDGMTCGRISGHCLVSFACCGMDDGAATAAMREDDRDEDLGSF
jgi:hypothetical protein